MNQNGPEPVTGSPIKYPEFTILGQSYSLKFSILAQYTADELGVDVAEFIRTVKETRAGKASTLTKLFAAMVAHNFVERGQPVPSPTYWASILGDDLDKFKEMCQAVVECLRVKFQASAMSLREPAPTSAPEHPVQ